MQVTRTKIRLGTRNRPEQTRAAILDAALHEFAQEGVSGARIDAIARSARVNKALLYYYFKDKESLYGAVIERVFGQLSERISEALARELPIREKYLAYVAAHFDYVAGNPLLPRIFMREWIRSGRSASLNAGRRSSTTFRRSCLCLAPRCGKEPRNEAEKPLRNSAGHHLCGCFCLLPADH